MSRIACQFTKTGLTRNLRGFSTSSRRNADFTHAVIGGGVVGLAIARKLQAREGASVVLIERHGSVGTETSSRNSEVIHAGIYYGTDSRKARLCVRGKELMYELCRKNDLPHNNCGKWIVAQDDVQREALEKVHALATALNVPIRWVSTEEAQRREPDVRALAGVLESPTTGIVDSHSFMQFLQGDFENLGGIVALQSPVTAVEPLQQGANGWNVTTTSPGGEEVSITAETLVNSAGLGAVAVSNMILPKERHRKGYYAKGSYFSYSLSHPKPRVLVYPAPVPGHGGLGTHLTLDMAGRIRFGPDVEWVDDPTDLQVNGSRLADALVDIQSYLPGVDKDALGLDYAGIRPKLAPKGSVTTGQGFNDFYIEKEEGFQGFVNLLGIESPGLTSSLAIAEEVEGILYK